MLNLQMMSSEASTKAGESADVRSRGVLFVAPFEPWCRENGSSVVIADLLAGLAPMKHSILPVFLRNPPAGAVRSRPPAMPGVTLGVEPLPRWLSVPAAVLSGRSPWWEMRFANRRIAQRILSHLAAEDITPSVVHVEHLVLVEIGEYLARRLRVPLVYRAHNIESQLWSRRLGERGRAVSAFLRHLERRELKSIRRCDLTLCISDVDRRWVLQRAPDARVDVLPVGLSTDRFAPPSNNGAVAKRVCFVGGLEWVPNEVGLRWFVDTVLPRILADVPDAKLAVLARGAADRPWLTGHRAIELMSPATDAVSLFSSSRVSIAPLMDGGGVRVKILESLAAGCPVVATPIGGEGLVLGGLTHTDEPDEFARACVGHLTQPDADNGRRVVQSNVVAKHGADAVARRLMEFWTLVGRDVRTPGRA